MWEIFQIFLTFILFLCVWLRLPMGVHLHVDVGFLDTRQPDWIYSVCFTFSGHAIDENIHRHVWSNDTIKWNVFYRKKLILLNSCNVCERECAVKGEWSLWVFAKNRLSFSQWPQNALVGSTWTSCANKCRNINISFRYTCTYFISPAKFLLRRVNFVQPINVKNTRNHHTHTGFREKRQSLNFSGHNVYFLFISFHILNMVFGRLVSHSWVTATTLRRNSIFVNQVFALAPRLSRSLHPFC